MLTFTIDFRRIIKYILKGTYLKHLEIYNTNSIAKMQFNVILIFSFKKPPKCDPK